MAGELFNVVAFSVIFSMLITFTLVPTDTPTGYAVSESGESGKPLYLVIFLLFVGVIFIFATRTGIERQPGITKGPQVNAGTEGLTMQNTYPTVAHYVENSLKAGYPAYEIEKALVSNGWPPDFVRNVISLKGGVINNSMAFADIEKDNIKLSKKRRYYHWL